MVRLIVVFYFEQHELPCCIGGHFTVP